MNETVHLVDWNEPEKNHFALAEEVMQHGKHERRPGDARPWTCSVT